MKFDKIKFALAAAATMTLAKAVKMFLWKSFFWRGTGVKGVMWKYHCGFGVKHFPMNLQETVPKCPWHYPFLKIFMVFAFTFAMAWFFAWLYNTLTSK